MDFKDWRKSSEKVTTEKDAPPSGKYRGFFARHGCNGAAAPTLQVSSHARSARYQNYIDEQIRQAQERGEFDNLQGTGKPLNLDSNPFAGEKAMGYGLLKSNGFAPPEIDLANEIRRELERTGAKLAKLRHQSRTLRSRRVPPFSSEKQAFNLAVKKATVEYEQTLRELNRKILALNLTAPAPMHRPMLEVDRLVQDFRNSCPLFD